MVARILLWLILLSIFTGCSVSQTEPISKIALLAPFEGQYREIGYDALYSARLALAASNITAIDLLAIDDGGTVELATQHVEALNQDPTVVAIIALGQYSTSAEVQSALDETPMLVVGYWGYASSQENIFNLSHPEIATYLNFIGDLNDLSDEYSTIIGGEILSLYQTPAIFETTSIIEIYSSASLPDEDFRTRYLASAEFAPEPNLLSTLTYDATNIILEAIATNTPLSEIEYEGINGSFNFEDNYWHNAPLNLYRYDDSTLVQIID